MITRADKGNSIVILPKTQYQSKIQGAAREMTCFDMDCTRPVGEVEGWGWWPWALYKMPFSCHHAFLVALSPRVRLRHVCNDRRVYR